jgi:dipeptidyl aminopeptidase/acylaminoacyl peptidase
MTDATPTRSDRAARIVVVLLLALLPLTLVAQNPPPAPQATAASWADEIIKQEGYAQPPPELAAAVLAPRHMNVNLSNLSPDKAWFLDEIEDGPVPLSRFARPFDEMGGLFIDYQANRTRGLTNSSRAGIQVISATDGTRKPVAIPAGARVSGARWTPDGAGVAYLAHTDTATHVWITDLATNKPRQITKTPLLATFVTNFEFVNEGRQIAAVLIPDGRTPRPERSAVPTGPEVRVAEESDRNRLRTYASLMTTPHDFALLEWHTTGQIGLVDVQTQAITKVGKPAMVRSLDVAPDGKHARVTRTLKPFSYIVPVNSFGQIEEIWDATGTALTKLSDRELNLGVQDDDPDPDDPPQGGGRGAGAGQNDKRDLSWRPDGTLVFLQQDPAPSGGNRGRAGRGGEIAAQGRGGRQGGAQGNQNRRDRLMQWLPPFSETSTKMLYENSTRMNGLRFSPDGQIIFFSETAGGTNMNVAVYLNDPAQKYVMTKRAGGGESGGRGGRGGRGGGDADADADPIGTLVGVASGGGGGGRGGRGGGGGGPVLLSGDGSSVFFQGTINDPKPQETGPKTFLDQVAIKTGTRTRIFESSNANVWERVATILDPDIKKFIITSESPKSPPQQFLYENGTRKQLTNNEDLFPDLTSMVIERFTAERPDGFRFRVTVNLPPGYQPGTRLPGMFWFYPREYSTQEAYDRGERTFNKNAFANFGTRSMEFLTRLGYAVIENDAPIVGPAGEMNNNYVHDLRTNLAVTIDELDRRGFIDRTRLGIGGHSYGAFSTVNAMVHTPFFKAGIAGDGAYNRTFTPLGFQSERRDLWQAPQVYLGMSPFLAANNLTGALLMYHGAHDQNVGTAPINSVRLFHALNGLGKTVSLYMYPFEDHGPAAKETQLDLWARWAAWLDKYVKNPQPTVKPDPNQSNGTGRGGGR